jgi:hypothetical protein
MGFWEEAMASSGQLDTVARLVSAILLAVWLIMVGLIFHAEYPRHLIELSGQPWWRLLMVAAAMAASYWCPRVGVLFALAVVLYLADLRALVRI